MRSEVWALSFELGSWLLHYRKAVEYPGLLNNGEHQLDREYCGQVRLTGLGACYRPTTIRPCLSFRESLLGEADFDAFAVGGEAFFGGQGSHRGGKSLHPFAVEVDHAPWAEKIVGRQAAGETGRAAGG